MPFESSFCWKMVNSVVAFATRYLIRYVQLILAILSNSTEERILQIVVVRDATKVIFDKGNRSEMPINFTIAAVIFFLQFFLVSGCLEIFLRTFLLIGGDWLTLLFCSQAFTGLTPKEFCIPTVLNNMITRALQLSLFADKLTFSRQLTFSLKWIPDLLKSTGTSSYSLINPLYKIFTKLMMRKVLSDNFRNTEAKIECRWVV